MAVNNSLTRASKPQPFSVVINSDGYKKLINNTLRDPKRANRFVASIVSAVSTNPALQECAPDTIVSAALLGESLGLSPSPQLAQFYLVPYDDKRRGCKIAQFQMGYRAYVELAIRSGFYKDIDTIEIREGEYKGRNKENGKPMFEFIEDDDVRETLPVIGYLAYYELLNGFKKSVYFSKEKMLKHADTYSKAFSAAKYKELQEGKIPKNEMWKYSSPWYSGFDGMALKTVLRQLLSKGAMLSVEMKAAFEGDMAAVNTDGTFDYVDNQPDKPDFAPGPEKVIDVETGEIKDESGLSEAEQAEILAAEAAEAQQSAEDDFFNQN